MNFSDKASKLILSTALFTLAGSIVFVSGTGLAQGATSTDKAISALKNKIKTLQERVQTLEDSPELLQGESGPEGPQGLQGLQGERGLTGASGTVSGFRRTSFVYYSPSPNLSCGVTPTLKVLTNASLRESTFSGTSLFTTNSTICSYQIAVLVPE